LISTLRVALSAMDRHGARDFNPVTNRPFGQFLCGVKANAFCNTLAISTDIEG